MRYIIDHDYHIHSMISLCSGDQEQTCERILRYAKENGLKELCLTNHYWDEAVPIDPAFEFYYIQNYDYLAKELPLPQDADVQFSFGCETELLGDLTLGISPLKYDAFSMIIIPTTHFHFSVPASATTEERAKYWVERFESVLDRDLPFHKVGIAHLACPLIANSSREAYLETLSLIPTEDMERLFEKAAKLGVGIELNSCDMNFSDEEAETVLRMFQIAKEKGCKFYLGSDAHHPAELDKAKDIFERAIDLLELTEDDKFRL